MSGTKCLTSVALVSDLNPAEILQGVPGQRVAARRYRLTHSLPGVKFCEICQ